MGIFPRSLLSIVTRKKFAFNVTPKEGIDHGGVDVLRALPLLVTMTTVLIVVWVARFVTWLGPPVLPPLTGVALAVTLVIGVYELMLIGLTIVPLLRRRQLRTHVRFRTHLAGSVDGDVVRVVDLSPQGFGLEGLGSATPGDELTLRLRLPGSDGDLHEVAIPGTVATVRRVGDESRGTPSKGSVGDAEGSPRLGRTFTGCSVRNLDPEVYDRIVEFCFVVQLTSDLRAGDETDTKIAAPGLSGLAAPDESAAVAG